MLPKLLTNYHLQQKDVNIIVRFQRRHFISAWYASKSSNVTNATFSQIQLYFLGQLPKIIENYKEIYLYEVDIL